MLIEVSEHISMREKFGKEKLFLMAFLYVTGWSVISQIEGRKNSSVM